MSKISKACFLKIPPEVYSKDDAAKYYFYLNTIDLSPYFHKDYEQYELDQNSMRSKVIADAIQRGALEHPNMNSLLFYVSTMHNTPAMVIKK